MYFENVDEVISYVAEINPEASFPSDLKEAIIGIVDNTELDTLFLMDRQKCLEILKQRDGMTHEEAIAYFETNINDLCDKNKPVYALLIRDIK